MRSAREVAEVLLKALEDKDLQAGLDRSILNSIPLIKGTLKRNPYIEDLAKRVKKAKDEVLGNIEYYIDKTMDNIRRFKGVAHFAKTREEVYKILDEVVGSEKIVVKAKSMVTEELKVREYLIERGNEVWETDLGELLVQLDKSKPMHTIVPSIHITKERSAQLLRGLGFNGGVEEVREMIEFVRRFLRERFVKAHVGISGANSVDANSGAVILVENEGNIRHVTNLPDIHVSIAGVEKIMPSYIDAICQAMVQAANIGTYPPTYLSAITGPSSTADIEFIRLYGVHGPKELHIILYDGGRIKVLKEGIFADQLHCIRCGRCQLECPIWQLAGNMWGGEVYGGPMGVIWTAITEGVEKAAPLALFCLNCGKCKEVCPMDIDIPNMMSELKRYYHDIRTS